MIMFYIIMINSVNLFNFNLFYINIFKCFCLFV